MRSRKRSWSQFFLEDALGMATSWHLLQMKLLVKRRKVKPRGRVAKVQAGVSDREKATTCVPMGFPKGKFGTNEEEEENGICKKDLHSEGMGFVEQQDSRKSGAGGKSRKALTSKHGRHNDLEKREMERNEHAARASSMVNQNEDQGEDDGYHSDHDCEDCRYDGDVDDSDASQRKHVRFADGSFAEKYGTKDGHPIENGKKPEPILVAITPSTQKRFTRKCVKEVEALLDGSCQDSLIRLRRRVGLEPLRMPDRRYITCPKKAESVV